MAFKYFEQINTKELPSMEVANVRAFLKDFAVSEDSEKPINSGLFRLEAGESLQYLKIKSLRISPKELYMEI